MLEEPGRSNVHIRGLIYQALVNDLLTIYKPFSYSSLQKVPHQRVVQIWNIDSFRLFSLIIVDELFTSFSLITMQLPEAHSDTQRSASHLYSAQLLWAAGELSDQPPGIRGECPHALSKQQARSKRTVTLMHDQ